MDPVAKFFYLTPRCLKESFCNRMLRASLLVYMSVSLLTSCAAPLYLAPFFAEEEHTPTLASINLIDQNGVSEIVSNPERLQQYATVNFLACQPYQKVMRVYKRNSQGNIVANIITYYPNGQPKQYLEVLNGRAFGQYREWYANGQLKVASSVIGGSGDLLTGSEKSWLFDGKASAWNENGVLLADIPYVKGQLEGTSLYYHETGAVWKKVPMSAGLIEGVEETFFPQGELFETVTYSRGLREGEAKRYWQNGVVAASELYTQGKLIEGLYYLPDGALTAELHDGTGYKAIFGRSSLKELQQYVEGVQDGLIKFFDKRQCLIRTCYMKNGRKHGEEVEYYPATTQPHLSIQWDKGKIHGLVRTWFPDGTPESQREMAENKKMGILTSWYNDGSLMLLEEYDQDKLIRGEYYEPGNVLPVSSVVEGKGLATFYTANGAFLRKVNYRLGQPEID